jgi:hypothetical protein
MPKGRISLRSTSAACRRIIEITEARTGYASSAPGDPEAGNIPHAGSLIVAAHTEEAARSRGRVLTSEFARPEHSCGHPQPAPPAAPMEFARSDTFDGPNLPPLGRFAPSAQPGHHVHLGCDGSTVKVTLVRAVPFRCR